MPYASLAPLKESEATQLGEETAQAMAIVPGAEKPKVPPTLATM
jgi:hypothetical protein